MRDLLPKQDERVLLLYPPVYDTRFPWSHWQQPVGLLKLASFCQGIGADARLLDAVTYHKNLKLCRKRVATLELDAVKVYKWRYGMKRETILEQMKSMSEAGWIPTRIYVEGHTTFWWQGVQEVVHDARRCFPNAQVILFGAYSDREPEHARANVAPDALLFSTCADLTTLPTDFSLYEQPPNFAYITFGGGNRTPDAIIDEVATKSKRWGVKNFAFVEHGVARDYPELYDEVLDRIATEKLKIKFYALGTVSARDIVENNGLALLLKKAGYKQIYFADDRFDPQSDDADEQLIAYYREAAMICKDAGYSPRSDDLIAAISLGRKGESLEARSRLATHVAHHLGSLIFWPYQPQPEECTDLPLEDRNAKLFPFRSQNDYTYNDYLHLMGLGVVFNSKHRTKTFDFLGGGLIETLFQESLGREAWNPDPAVKGSVRLPMVNKNND